MNYLNRFFTQSYNQKLQDYPIHVPAYLMIQQILSYHNKDESWEHLSQKSQARIRNKRFVTQENDLIGQSLISRMMLIIQKKQNSMWRYLSQKNLFLSIYKMNKQEQVKIQLQQNYPGFKNINSLSQNDFQYKNLNSYNFLHKCDQIDRPWSFDQFCLDDLKTTISDNLSDIDDDFDLLKDQKKQRQSNKYQKLNKLKRSDSTQSC